ncbi:MAG: hypothetical protein KDC27_20620 [Acidobacteria bacterium]|nr:hypothetical protein [Acidobacteriota bacterium]
MNVESLHLTLLWPLRMDCLALPDGVAKCARYVADSPSWSKCDPLQVSPNNPVELRHAELAYFHPFTRKLLFEGSTVLERRDVRAMRCLIATKRGVLANSELTLNVDCVQLRLFETGVAMLTVELSRDEPLPLDVTQDLLDQVRRAYRPYWELRRLGENKGVEPKESDSGHCPVHVSWMDEKGHPIGNESTYGHGEAKQRLLRVPVVQPAISEHWRWLLAPLQGGVSGSGGWCYEQILDERIPAMAHLSFANPRALTSGDFIRLALMDDSGSSATLPYAKEFLARFEQEHCYDRFWEVEPGSWMATRFMTAGYSFVMTGEKPPDSMKNEDWYPGFFMDDLSGGLAHFRHHYFQLGLLAHLQEASLLVLLDQMAAAAQCLRVEDPQDADVKKARDLRRRMALFAGRYWFTEVTNQVQGRELFDLWRRHLDSEKLFREAMEQIGLLDSVLADIEEKRAQDWRDEMEKILGLGAMIGLGLGFFGMSSFVGDLDQAIDYASEQDGVGGFLAAAWEQIAWGEFLIVLIIGAALALYIQQVWKVVGKRKREKKDT